MEFNVPYNSFLIMQEKFRNPYNLRVREKEKKEKIRFQFLHSYFKSSNSKKKIFLEMKLESVANKARRDNKTER